MTILTAGFSPDGRSLVTGSSNGYLCEWEVETGRRRRVLLDPRAEEDERPRVVIVHENGHEEDAPFQLRRLSESMRGAAIRCVRFAPDGTRFAVGAANGQVVIWNAESRGELAAWEAHGDEIRALDFSPDGRFLATGSGGEDGKTVRVWRVASLARRWPEEVFSDGSHVGGVSSLNFSPDSRFLAAGGYTFSGYTGPLLYDIESRTRVGSFCWDVTSTLRLSPDGRSLATGNDEGEVSVWEVARRERVFGESTDGRLITVVEFSPDGGRVASGDEGGDVRLWDIAAEQQVSRWPLGGAILALWFSPSGHELLVVSAVAGADSPIIHRAPV
jgi:WD40 repeat protein